MAYNYFENIVSRNFKNVFYLNFFYFNVLVPLSKIPTKIADAIFSDWNGGEGARAKMGARMGVRDGGEGGGTWEASK